MNNIESRIGGLRLDDDEPRARDEALDQFPIGMRMLVVDTDRPCLLHLETMLLNCNYHVTSSCDPATALGWLRESKHRFDLVMTAVDMPDTDGFKFLELVQQIDVDLPVILLSASGDAQLVMKGISNGACDFLLKPVTVEQLKLIWKHVFRIRRRKKINVDLNTNISAATATTSCCASAVPLSTKRRRKQEDNKDISTPKLDKSEMVWLKEFNQMLMENLSANRNWWRAANVVTAGPKMKEAYVAV